MKLEKIIDVLELDSYVDALSKVIYNTKFKAQACIISMHREGL